jgi:hypothetical protein
MPLWSIPEDVVQRIVVACAGDREEWLQEGDELRDEWSHHLSGLTYQQCLSSELLHTIVLPHVTNHPALLAPREYS